MIALYLDNSVLSQLLPRYGITDRLLFFFNEKNQIVTLNNNTDIKQQNLEEIRNLSSPGMPDGSRITNRLIDYNNMRFLAVKRSMDYKDLNIGKWSILYMMPFSQFNNKIFEAIISNIFVSMLYLVILFIIVLLISDGIMHRIHSLAGHMKRIQNGDLSIGNIVRGADEIAILENGLIEMVGRINSLIKDVVDANIKIRDVEIHSQKIQLEKKDSEIRFLQGQINPHYFFNTLETIRMQLITKNNVSETAEIIRIFGESFRQCIDRTRRYFTIKEEINFLKMYMRIQEYRYNWKIQFSIEVESGLENCRIPKLLIQPVVENAIFHGIEKRQGGQIKIRFRKSENDVGVVVSDDGVGMGKDELACVKDNIYGSIEEAANEELANHALRNIHTRIMALYGDGYGLKISSVKNVGTIVQMKIPSEKCDLS